jgi:DNA-binding CsgD family transcriptional regulator
LKKTRKASKQDQQKELVSIVQSIALNSKEIGWEEFELRFKEVHPSFYERLARHNPNLTSNENRLCAFLKLNMTSKEISAFTFQTEHSIIQARSRLKKKFDIMDTQRLSQFIATL